MLVALPRAISVTLSLSLSLRAHRVFALVRRSLPANRVSVIQFLKAPMSAAPCTHTHMHALALILSLSLSLSFSLCAWLCRNLRLATSLGVLSQALLLETRVGNFSASELRAEAETLTRSDNIFCFCFCFSWFVLSDFLADFPGIDVSCRRPPPMPLLALPGLRV